MPKDKGGRNVKKPKKVQPKAAPPTASPNVKDTPPKPPKPVKPKQ